MGAADRNGLVEEYPRPALQRRLPPRFAQSDPFNGHRLNGHRLDGHTFDVQRLDGHRLNGHRSKWTCRRVSAPRSPAETATTL